MRDKEKIKTDNTLFKQINTSMGIQFESKKSAINIRALPSRVSLVPSHPVPKAHE
jgi:hypothetical protein